MSPSRSLQGRQWIVRAGAQSEREMPSSLAEGGCCGSAGFTALVAKKMATIFFCSLWTCNTETGQAEFAGETRIRLQVVADLEALGKQAPTATWRC